ncbi:class I SAM-dependent methyltransferase [Candidatus Uabimicrobium sp. HlEnr_7]|uniref:class I SAM-dependent methyltransferase n=1 Tax=Candidatus Uabimicrobium helgolandensis TaxID=3095367 RepID=UPI0035560E1B
MRKKHHKTGTNYGDNGVKKYSKSKHGPDGKIFLDKYLTSLLNKYKKSTILDVGCGVGIWSAYMANLDNVVVGLDIQKKMIDIAKGKYLNLQNLNFIVGDTEKLPFREKYFDLILSLNVGCNLPSTTFRKHFNEISRVLKDRGIAIVTLPDSLDLFFTDRNHDSDTLKKLVCKDIESTKIQDLEDVLSKKSYFSNIMRSTFIVRNNKVIIPNSSNSPVNGEKIWRKIPGLLIPNFSHSYNEYVKVAQETNLKIKKVYRESFKNHLELEKHNQNSLEKLGCEYIGNPVFSIIVLERIGT